jgi:hypothetical protein
MLQCFPVLLRYYFTPLHVKLRSVPTGVRGALVKCNSCGMKCPGPVGKVQPRKA